jgi:hypothetical protein
VWWPEGPKGPTAEIDSQLLVPQGQRRIVERQVEREVERGRLAGAQHTARQRSLRGRRGEVYGASALSIRARPAPNGSGGGASADGDERRPAWTDRGTDVVATAAVAATAGSSGDGDSPSARPQRTQYSAAAGLAALHVPQATRAEPAGNSPYSFCPQPRQSGSAVAFLAPQRGQCCTTALLCRRGERAGVTNP